MKRRAVKLARRILLFLLLGAIINLAIAILLSNSTPTGWASGFVTVSAWTGWTPPPPALMPTTSDEVAWTVAESHSFGSLDLFTATSVAVDRLFVTATPWSDPNVSLTPRRVDHVTVPCWSFAKRTDVLRGFESPFVTVEEGARGWPMLAFRYEIRSDYAQPQATPPQAVGIIWSFRGRPVPGLPIWKGFWVNNVFYGALLWLALCGPRQAKRIIRTWKKQCPGCGYPIGTSAVCTECGKPMPRLRATY